MFRKAGCLLHVFNFLPPYTASKDFQNIGEVFLGNIVRLLKYFETNASEGVGVEEKGGD